MEKVYVMNNSNIDIDESELVPAPTLLERLKSAAIAVVLGATLVQMLLFYGAVKRGSFVPASVVIYFDNFYFLGYLAICGGLGWMAGQDFLDWLKSKIGYWKFW